MAENSTDPRRGVNRGAPKASEDGEQAPTPKVGPDGKPIEANTGMRPPRALFFIVLMLIMGFFAFLLVNGNGMAAKTINYGEFENLYTTYQIKQDSVVVRDDGLLATRIEPLSKDEKETVYVAFGKDVQKHFLDKLDKAKIRYSINLNSGLTTALISNLLSFLLPLLILIFVGWFLLFRGIKAAGGGPGGMLGNFGKSRHRMLVKEKTGVTFDDVAGIDEAKDEVEEIIQFLKAPKRFMKLGGRVPRGVLLIGEPGCGKTLLAKAIAGEADVPFFSISGSDFVEMFVGVGASRVRDLFKQAKESAPCIIFLDEIDAVGRRRGGGFTTGGHDEREQTLNAILVEMDGFATGDGVIVVAATNRSDVLDPALTRPGRFDRQIIVPLPDVKGRLEIIRVHAKNKKLGPDVNLERLAKATPMFSGADLFALMNEAAIAATLQNKDFIEQEDFEEARDKVKFGRAKKSRVREADENKLTAYHEAGHAVLQALLKDADPLHKVTIIPRGNAGGATFSLPEKDRFGYGLKWLRATMRVACGGRIAEAKAMGDASSGAVQDISTITGIAHTMVEEWGMSEKLGFVRYSAADTREMYQPERQYSEETARLIDEEVKRLVGEAYADAERTLTEHWAAVEAVAQALLKHETLDASEVHKLMRGETLSRPTVSELLDAEARKSSSLGAIAAGAAGGSAANAPKHDLPPGAMPTPA
ncbi:hypothetical protein BH11PLA1_BH11PLA1_05450 [soil metagenome]